MKLYVFTKNSRLITTALAVITGMSMTLVGCRLGANNEEKLEALKAGHDYNEDGIILPSPSPSVTYAPGTLTISDPDPVYRPGETISLSIAKKDGESAWTSIKLQYSESGTSFVDVADVSLSATSIDWTISEGTGSTRTGTLRLIATDAGGNTITSNSTSTIHVVTKAKLVAGVAHQTGHQDGIGTASRFRGPLYGMTQIGNALYIGDLTTIRKVDISSIDSPVVTTLIGKPGVTGSTDGGISSARFTAIRGITTDGTDLYVSDGHAIRKVTMSTLTVTTLSGVVGTSGAVDGDSSTARYNVPWGLTIVGSNLYIGDYDNHAIRKFDLGTNTASTFAGTMGSSGTTNADGTAARFNRPVDLTNDGSNLYVIDFTNRLVRKVSLTTPYPVTTVAGSSATVDGGARDGIATAASFTSVSHIHHSSGYLYVSERTNAATIRQIDLGTNTVTTYAGLSGQPGANDGVTSTARLYNNRGLLATGGYLYVLSEWGCNVRRIKMSDKSITTIAGAPASLLENYLGNQSANINFPVGLAMDGTDLMFNEGTMNTIRRLNLGTNTITTEYGLAGWMGNNSGVGTAARLSMPDNLIKVGNDFFFSEPTTHTIKRIDSSGNVSVYAGEWGTSGTTDGAGTSARFNGPRGMTAIGTNIIYVADYSNHRIRKIDISTIGSPVVSTIAGSTAGGTNASGSSAKFYGPIDVATDGTNLYVTDYTSSIVRKVDLGNNAVTTLAGTYNSTGTTDASGATARFNKPRSVAYAGGFLYIADSSNHMIRKLNLGDNAVTTLAGNGSAGLQDGYGFGVRLNTPIEILVNGTTLYISDYYSHALRAMDLGTNYVRTIAGGATISGSVDGPTTRGSIQGFGSPVFVGSKIYYSSPTAIYRRDSASTSTLIAGHASEASHVDSTGSSARFTSIRSLAAGNGVVYAIEQTSHVIRQVNISTGQVTTLAGTYGVSGSADGIGTAATFTGVRFAVSDGTYLYAADSTKHTIRRITLSDGTVTTIAGTNGTAGGADGIGTNSTLSVPDGMVIIGKMLYLASSSGNVIRKLDITNPDAPVVMTLAGTYGTAGYQDGSFATALFSGPKAMTTDGKNIYVVDDGTYVIRKLNLSTGTVSTFFGSQPNMGNKDGPFSSAGMWGCSNGITYHPNGFLLGCAYHMIELH